MVEAKEFEQNLWQEYGLIGDVDPEHLFKECQKKAREAEDETLRKITMLGLNALDAIHKLRKELSRSFVLGQKGIWPEAEEALPKHHWQSLAKTIDQNFWAVLIGNNKYTDSGPGKKLDDLKGCINDTELLGNYLVEHLGVRKDRVRILHNATRKEMLDALYDLRDNVHIQFCDNILVHFSGHGSTYDAKSFFESAVGSAGSIEAICPSDRRADNEIPDISDRELNNIFSEVRDAKGENITFIADCCYSGGMMRATDEVFGIRSLAPIRLGPMSMLKAAERHPRRKSSVLASSDNWNGDISAFVHLAACQDFQLAGEVSLPDGRIYGAFTFALVNDLKSRGSQGRTYTDVIQSIGQLDKKQIPNVSGERKESRLWFK